MRVSSMMMTNNYLTQLNSQYQRQADLMEQSDGSSIHRPSDDPVAYVKTLNSKVSLAQNDQATESLDTATSWLESTDDAMVNIKDILSTINEKTTEAANGTNSDSDLVAASEEIDALIEEVISQANSQLGTRYLFSGSADTTKPYTTGTVSAKADVKTLDDTQASVFNADEMLVLTDTSDNTYYMDTATGSLYTKDYVDSGYETTIANNSTATTSDLQTAVAANAVGTLPGFTAGTFISTTFNANGTVSGSNSYAATLSDGTAVTLSFSTSDKNVVGYNGDNAKISMPISGEANPDNDSVNSTGTDLFGTDIFGGEGMELINNLYEISAHMKAGDTDWLASDGITLAQSAFGQVTAAETSIGARQSAYETRATALGNQNTQITTDITNTSASDTAALIVALQTAETLYNMSLSVGANILPLSLSDYLS